MAVITQQRPLVWFGRQLVPPNISAALDGHWRISWCQSEETFHHRLREAQVVMIAPSVEEGVDPVRLSHLLDAVDRSGAVALVLLPTSLAGQFLDHRHGQFIPLSSDSSPATVRATLEAATALQPVIRHLRADAAASRGFADRGVATNIRQMDEEMRLAARLQRDFLPQRLPEVGTVRFQCMFRPTSWVSGDIYDVFRLDETHVGFYVADVVGHGLPAALMTMFIKKALQTKRITGNTYEIIPPHEALAQLNEDICQQNFSSCQFCTAVYGVLDSRTLLLEYCRGGHPTPIRLDSGGEMERLDAPGTLLGVFPGEAFHSRSVQMRPGDRLVLYSDGAEDMLATPDPGKNLPADLHRLRELTAEALLMQLTCLLEERHVGNGCDDDVTLLVMDIADASGADSAPL